MIDMCFNCIIDNPKMNAFLTDLMQNNWRTSCNSDKKINYEIKNLKNGSYLDRSNRHWLCC